MRTLFLTSASIFALGITSAMADETATSNQRGTGGGIYINQANNTDGAMATIRQGQVDTPGSSDGDVASTYQTGTGYADATIKQNTGGPGGGNNLAGIVQSDGTDTAGSVDGTSATISQDGSFNTGGVRQQGTGNKGMLKQDGTSNQAVVKQGDARNETFDILNSSIPSADENWQALNFNFDEEKVQGHSRDTPPGGIDGFPDPAPEGIVMNSMGEIYQNGDGSKAAILQVTGSGHEGKIDQLASGNEARILQAGDSQDAVVEQAGMNNGADVRQQNADHEAKILQTGDMNITLVDQTGTMNFTSVRQGGLENTAMVAQLGELDEARVDQKGNNNTANVWQEDDGVKSNATVKQSGNMNISVINQ